MNIEQDLLALKRKIEHAKSERDRAEGALEETKKQLRALSDHLFLAKPVLMKK